MLIKNQKTSRIFIKILNIINANHAHLDVFQNQTGLLSMSNRCLYKDSFAGFVSENDDAILRKLCDNYYEGTYQYLKSIGIEEI